MLTTLDTQSWAKELVTGNAQFVEVLKGSPPEPTLYIVSNVRADNSFCVLRSVPTPPTGVAPGPGAVFTTVATYTFSQTNSDFDPAVAYDPNSGSLHIVGTQNNPTGHNSSDFIKFTFDTNTNTLTGPVILTIASQVRDGYDVAVLENGNCIVAVSVLDATGYPGENLLAFELNGDTYVGSVKIIASSPDRSGNTFSAVSLVNPSGTNDIELYYGAHPKVYNFKDQFFTVNLTHRTSGTWDATPTNLFTFTARYADDSLTVIPDLLGNRYLSWTFWTQSDTPEGIIGNVVLGTLQENSWLFNPIYGSSIGGSVVQSTLSVTQANAVSLAYLLEPFNPVTMIPAMGTLPAYPLIVANVTPTLGVTNAAGWYNQQVFTWLRGTNTAIDTGSTWAVIGEAAKIITVTDEAQTIPASGVVQVAHFDDTPFSNYWENVGVAYSRNGVALVEVVSSPAQGQYAVEPTNGRYIFNLADVGVGVQISYSYVGTKNSTVGILPVYVSLFNVPPIVGLEPPRTTCETPLIVYRDTGTSLGQPVVLDASKTKDSDQDDIEYWWSNNDTTGFVTLTPSGVWSPSFFDTSILSVSPLIGGAADTFNVGVAAVDLYPDGITQRHPPLNVTSYQISGDAVTFTYTPDQSLAVGEEVMTWNIMTLSPPSLVPSLNDQVWVVTVVGTETFTAVPLCGGGSPPSSPTPPSPVTTELASAADYAILAYSGITNTGSTVIAGGNVGSYPTNSITPGAWTLTSPAAVVTATAQNQTDLADAITYYEGLGGSGQVLTTADMGTQSGGGAPTGTYYAGNYYSGSSLAISTPIILDAQGNPDAVFVFYATASTITQAIAGTITLANGAQAANVVWVCGSSWTSIGPGAVTVGNILAHMSITLGGGTLTGRALANTGAVTISTAETITVPAGGLVPISVTGYAIPQYQFAVITIEVPYNYPPVIVFPSPEWVAAGSPPSYTLATTVARNTQIEISQGSTQYPVEYFGISDPDDVVTYAWVQVSGTPVTIFGAALPTFKFATNGVAIQGEDLVFQLTLSDGVNPPDVVQFTIPVAGYDYQGQDDLQLSRSVYSGNISQRNQAGTWGTVDISILYNDLQAIKRNSVNDGSDRYIVISPYSVLVYGGIYLSSQHPMVLLRKLLTPNQTRIIDAVHTEDDYTLVLDNAGNVFRYNTATFIYTDNPDTTIRLSGVSSFTFNRILCTFSYANQRVLMFGGPDGVLLLQVANDTLQITGTLEISSESNMLYGANNVQFIRTAGVESLRSGQILIGTIEDTQTYETLISLSQGVIIGTWNASKLKNQIVNTGEILFNPNSDYSGYPLPPADVTATTSLDAQGATLIVISWVQQRPDLVERYNVQYSTDGVSYSQLQSVGSGMIQSITVQLAPRTYWFRVQAVTLDGTSDYSLSATITI